jgi:hypothetical protein
MMMYDMYVCMYVCTHAHEGLGGGRDGGFLEGMSLSVCVSLSFCVSLSVSGCLSLVGVQGSAFFSFLGGGGLAFYSFFFLP